MPAIDWVHVAMFFLGLVLQWLGSRAGSPSAPTLGPQQPPPVDANMLLDLAHKLLDERRQLTKN
jgi:hypothetical protein